MQITGLTLQLLLCLLGRQEEKKRTRIHSHSVQLGFLAAVTRDLILSTLYLLRHVVLRLVLSPGSF